MELHEYRMTMSGRCGSCGQTEFDHPKLLRDGPDPMTECPVDHRSINTQFLVADGGGRWTFCPHCQRQVEGAMAKHVMGPDEGPGRGPLTDFQMRWLTQWKNDPRFH